MLDIRDIQAGRLYAHNHDPSRIALVYRVWEDEDGRTRVAHTMISHAERSAACTTVVGMFAALWRPLTPPTTPFEALTHVLAVHTDAPDDGMAIHATQNAIGPGVVTGLTWGDLRALAQELDAKATAA